MSNRRLLDSALATLVKRSAHFGLGLSAFTPVLALANPSGGQVVAGQANITAQNANNMVIHQGTQSAIIDWQQFNIGAGQYVQFLQPSSSSVVLNRVVGGSPTSILGNLTANGQVFLVNTNGVYFAKGASIDAQGFLASTLDIRDSDFLAHNYQFGIAGSNGATVVNEGSIKAHNGGYVVLAGDYAQNTGIITAQSGHVILAAGSKATLSLSGNQLVNFAVNQATLASYVGVSNSGSLIADGGTVVMTADVANALKATVVNNSGLVEAKSMSAQGGHIYLTATGGNITNAGTINASAGKVGAAGGDIVLKGDGRTTLTDASKITATGNGAHGGHLELSGDTLSVRGTVAVGKGGGLLIDPNSVELVQGSSNSGVSQGTSAGPSVNVSVGFIEQQLNDGASVAISAHDRIFHTNSVTAITATGAGNLTFKTATGGHVDLSGVDINITGAFAATMDHGSFGFIQAGSVDITAATSVEFKNAILNSKGVIKQYSIKATAGDINISADRIGVTFSAAGQLAMHAADGIQLGADIANASLGVLFAKVVLQGKTVTDSGLIRAAQGLSVTATDGSLSLKDVDAGGVTLTASDGDIELGNVLVANGALTITTTNGSLHAGSMRDVSGKDSITVGDDVVINGKLTATGDLTLTAGGDVQVGRLVSGGNLKISAKNHLITITSGSPVLPAIDVDGNVNLTADEINYSGTGPMQVEASGNININGLLGQFASGYPDGLLLSAGGDITLSRSVTMHGDLIVRGQHLRFAGSQGTYSLSARGGDLKLDASIGSVAAPSTHGIRLDDSSGNLLVQRSIYTTNNHSIFNDIDLTLKGPIAAGGIFIGGDQGNTVVLSTKGNIDVKGGNIWVGKDTSASSALAALLGTVGAVKLVSGRNIILTGSSSSGRLAHVSVIAADADAIGDTVDTSISFKANGSVALSGAVLQVRGGEAHAQVSGTETAAKANASVSITAVLDVLMSGGASADGSLSIAGGDATARASSLVTTHAVNANAKADVSITAGKFRGMTKLTADHIRLAGGVASATALAGTHQTAKAAAHADTIIDGGLQLQVIGGSGSTGSIVMTGGAGVTGLSRALLGAKSTVVASGNLSVIGGDSMSISARHVNITGGAGVGSYATTGGSDVRAFGAGAKAALDLQSRVQVTACADISGGFCNINVFAGGTGSSGLLIAGGARAGRNQKMLDFGGSSVIADIDASVTFTAHDVTAGGGLNFKSNRMVQLHGGASAASGAALEGTGGSAALSVNSGVFMDVDAVSIIASDGAGAGSMSLSGGMDAARAASIHGNNGHAVLTVNSGLLVSAIRNVELKAANILDVRGGAGLVSSRIISTSSDTVGTTGTSGSGSTAHSFHDFTHKQSRTVDMGWVSGFGQNASATLTGFAGVGITAGGDLDIVGTQSVGIQGGDQAGKWAAAVAFEGKGTLTADASVHLQAAKTLSIKGGNLTVRGGNSLALASQGDTHGSVMKHCVGSICSTTGSNSNHGSPVSTRASNSGARANLRVTGAVDLVGHTVTLDASAGDLTIQGGHSTGRNMHVHALDTGQSKVHIAGGVTVTATGAFTAKAAGSLHLSGGSLTAASVSASASGAGASADIAADAGISVKGGSVTLTAATGDVSIAGGDGVAQEAEADATTGAKASVTGDASVMVNATVGALSLKGKHDFSVRGGNHAAGGKTTTTTGAGGGGGTSTGGTSGGSSSSGTASGSTYLVAGHRTRSTDYAQAQATGKGAKATITGSAGVSLSAKGAINLVPSSAGGSVLVQGGSSAAASVAGVASAHGKAAVSGHAAVSIKAGGALKLSGQHVTVRGGRRVTAGAASSYSMDGVSYCHSIAGTCDFVSSHTTAQIAARADTAMGAGAQALIQGDASVSLRGGTVSLKGSDSIQISGGHDLADSAQGQAGTGGGSIALAAKSRVDVTAANALSVTLTGSAAGGHIWLLAGGSNGKSALTQAAGLGAQAHLAIDGGVGMVVTATGGTLTVDTGLHTGTASIRAGTRTHDGDHLQVDANDGAAATTTMTDVVSLGAGGTLALKTLGNMYLAAAGSHAASGARALASGAAAKAADTMTEGLRLTGGSVVLQTPKWLSLGGAGSSVARGAKAIAAGVGASAAMNVAVDTVITTTTGALSGSGALISLFGADAVDGRSAGAMASGSGAKAALTQEGSVVLKAKGNLVLKAIGGIVISGNSDADVRAGMSGTASAHSHAAATLSDKDTVTITAGGAFNATAGGGIEILGGSGMGYKVAITADGVGGKAAFDGDARVTINVGALKFKTAGDITLSDGANAGESTVVHADDAGSAAMKISSGLGITTKTTLALNGDHIKVQPGAGILSHASASASGSGAKAAITVDGRTSLKAGTNLTITGHSSLILTSSLDVASSSAPVAHITGGASSKITGKTGLAVSAGNNLTLSLPTDAPGGVQIFSGDGYSASSGRVLIGGTAAGGVALSAGGKLTINGPNPVITGVGPGGGFGFPGLGGASGCVSIATGCGAGATITITAGGDFPSSGAYHPQAVRLPETGPQDLGTVRDQAIVISLETLISLGFKAEIIK